jgi:integrase
MRERNLNTQYISQTRKTLRSFAEFNESKGNLSAKGITSETLREYMSRYANKSAAYQRFNYAIIRGFLVFAEHPLAFKFKYRAQGRGRRVRWLTVLETEKVLTSRMKPREALEVTSGLLAGMRRCEVLRLTVRDAKDALRTGEITAYAKGKTRLIPVHPEYAQVLRIYLQATDLGDNSPLLPISKQSYDYTLRELGKRIEIPLSAHVLRRTCLTRLREADVELDVISRIAGHSSVEMTQRYIQTDVREMKEAILKLSVPTTEQSR